jgi:hypothetical protein
MDREAQIQAIDEDLRALHGMPVDSDQSARDALTQAMVTVRRINQLSAQAQAQAMMGAGTPMDDILAKLREWFDRLVTELTRIVEKLAQATSFSISVGTALSVTVNFGPQPLTSEGNAEGVSRLLLQARARHLAGRCTRHILTGDEQDSVR